MLSISFPPHKTAYTFGLASSSPKPLQTHWRAVPNELTETSIMHGRLERTELAALQFLKPKLQIVHILTSIKSF